VSILFTILHLKDHSKTLSFFLHTKLYLLAAPRRVTRSVHRTLYVSCDPILARIKLASNNSILAERSTNLLANLADGTVRVELLANGARRGDYAGVLRELIRMWIHEKKSRGTIEERQCWWIEIIGQ
jgi:hypothetical protein